MSDIDWSKAPEGATHWGPDCESYIESWYQLIGDDESFIRVGESRDWQKLTVPMKYVRRLQLVSRPEPIPDSTTSTLETMLAEWRDLEARAQVAQAEADALFEHAGQCHGGIVVRLAELGWGAPRAATAPDESIDITDWRDLRPGDIIEPLNGCGWVPSVLGKEARVIAMEQSAYMGDLPILAVNESGFQDWGDKFRFIRRPSTQP